MNFPSIGGFLRNIGRAFRTVPYRAKHVAAWAVVKVELALGRNYQQITSDMERVGLIAPHSPFKKDVEGYVNMLDRQASLIGWPENAIPGFEQVVDMPFRRASHFRWIVRVYIKGEYKGLTGWQFISLFTNRLMTPRELMANVGLYIVAGSEPIQRQVIDYEIWSIQHNPGAPWQQF